MNEQLADMEFEARIKGMSDRDLNEDTARNLYFLRKQCGPCMRQVQQHDTELNQARGAIVILALLFTAALGALANKLFRG